MNINTRTFEPTFTPVAIALATKEQNSDHTFYLSGSLSHLTGPEIVIAELSPEGFASISTFEEYELYEQYEDMDMMLDVLPPELAVSREGRLFGFQPFGTGSERLLEFNTQSGSYAILSDISLGVVLGYTFVYTLNRYYFFAVDENLVTHVYVYNPLTDHISYKDSIDMSVIGTSMSSCFQEDSAY